MIICVLLQPITLFMHMYINCNNNIRHHDDNDYTIMIRMLVIANRAFYLEYNCYDIGSIDHEKTFQTAFFDFSSAS